MKNYKTSLVGILAAIVLAIQPFLGNTKFNFQTEWPQLAGAVLIAVLGLVAKDHDVTGGTRPQPSPPSTTGN